MKHRIICIGEILWDSLPQGRFLGGAPYNVAYHLKKLGENVVFISRIGSDELRRETLRQVKQNGISTDFIQVDESLPTGLVEVHFNSDGNPQYDIKKPAAWDNIGLTENVKKEIDEADAIIFGTLAQRSPTSANTIQYAGEAAGLRVLDLNLRAPYDSQEVIHRSLQIADLVKVNDRELEVLQEIYKLPSGMKQVAEKLAETFGLKVICITCGADGAYLWNKGEWSESKGFRVEVADTIGSGDAFLAVIVAGYLENLPSGKLLKLANRLGAWVASQSGGTPEYAIRDLQELGTLVL